MISLSYPNPTVDWKEFMNDLNQQPKMAHCTLNGAYTLQYALRFPNVPFSVIERLIKLHPEALEFSEPDFGWNTLFWMLHCNVDEISNIDPNILKTILIKGDPHWAVEGSEESLGCTPIEWFIDLRGPTSNQVKAILDSSPDAVAFFIRRIYMGKEKVQPELLTVVLNAASQWELELDDDGGFLNGSDSLADDDSYEEDESRTLLDVIFNNIEKGKMTLFRRILNIKARAIREAQKDICGPLLNITIDSTSLTCCVLLCLGEWDRLDLWPIFADTCKDELKKPTKDGSLPLVTAIRLGYQWNPVLKSLVEVDRQALEGLDAKDRMPPFLTAASVLYDWHYLGMGLRGDCYPSRENYKELNSINNTMEILRINPNMIRRDHIINPAAVAKKKEKKKRSSTT